MKPVAYPQEFYSFQNYVTKHRMLTFWYQISEILNLKPSNVLEVGVGSGFVASYLRHLGMNVSTIDINPGLKADHVGSLLDMRKYFHEGQFDLVICARVLHHLSFDRFESAIENIASVTNNYALITLPFNEISFYFMFRYTSSRIKTVVLPLPIFLKTILLGRNKANRSKHSSFWKINDSSYTQLEHIRSIVSRRFHIINEYRLPEDSAHYLMVLRKL